MVGKHIIIPLHWLTVLRGLTGRAEIEKVALIATHRLYQEPKNRIFGYPWTVLDIKVQKFAQPSYILLIRLTMALSH